MSQPFLAQVTMFGGTFAPRMWAFCNGQLMPIAQNEALYSLLGTTYGGDGVQTYGLPNMISRLPVTSGKARACPLTRSDRPEGRPTSR